MYDDGNASDGADDSPADRTKNTKAPWVDLLHEFLSAYRDAKCVDGDELRFDWSAVGKTHFPWPNLTMMLISVWSILTRPSRAALQLLLDLLRYVDPDGCRFDPRDLPRSAEHLIARGRLLLPLLKVFERPIKDKGGNETYVLDIPFGVLLQRMFSCPAVMEELLENTGGHVMSAEERSIDRVTYDHLTPQATNNADGAKSGFMTGTWSGRLRTWLLNAFLPGQGSRSQLETRSWHTLRQTEPTWFPAA